MEKNKRDMNLSELGAVLEPHHLEFMPKSIYESSNGQVYAQVLAYKNARTDMEILDTVVFPENWQNEYKRDSNGVLQCGIGIYSEVRGEWIWKWSNGVPSKVEKEKGEYSDAFKRAGYLWGIGRCLYSFPRIKISLNDKEWKRDGDKVRATGYLKPTNWDFEIWIDYQSKEYEHIVVTDKQGTIKFNMNPHKKKFKDPTNRQNVPE